MPREVNRRTVLQGIGAASIVGLAGCAGGGGDDGSRELRQGVLLPTSGGLANLGVPIKDAAILPFSQLEGETDFTINEQVEDTQTDANAAQNAANSLVNSGYPAVTGAASSEVSLAVARNVFIPNDVVACSPASTSTEITDLEDKDLFFRTPPTDALQGPVIAQVASDRIEASSAAVLYLNNSYGQLLNEAFASAFDGDITAQVSFQAGQSSYTSQLNQVTADDPDMLMIVGYPESGVQIFRDFYSSFDSELPIVVTDGMRDPALPTDVGNAMANVQGTAPSAAGPGAEFFTTQFEEAYGEAPGVFTAQAYDATAVCLLANAKAGTNAGPAIAEEMRPVTNPGGETVTPENLAEGLSMAADGTDITYEGASGPVQFDENGDLAAGVYEVYGFQDGGGIETLTTIEVSN